MHILGLEVPHTAVGIGDHYFLCASIQRPLDGGVQVAHHQLPPDLVLVLVTTGLSPMDDAGDTLHVDGDENLLRLLRHAAL